MRVTVDTILQAAIAVKYFFLTNILTEQGCTGAPDWSIEIVSPGNSSHDYIRKLNLYAGAGVREYWIADPAGKSVKAVQGRSLPFQHSFLNRFFSTVRPDIPAAAKVQSAAGR